MIPILLIIGIGGICQAKELSGSGIIQKEHSFGEISSDQDIVNQDNGLPLADVILEPDTKNSASSWDYYDSHGVNHISESTDDKQALHGLDTWLADIVVGKDFKGLVKPIIKEIGYPVYKDVKIEIPYPQVQQTPHPYPVLIPMLHPVPYEVIKTIIKTVEKKVPTPVEKIVPMPVEKPVPFEVIKHVPMFVEKKIPIKIPVFKTIYHKIYNY